MEGKTEWVGGGRRREGPGRTRVEWRWQSRALPPRSCKHDVRTYKRDVILAQYERGRQAQGTAGARGKSKITICAYKGFRLFPRCSFVGNVTSGKCSNSYHCTSNLVSDGKPNDNTMARQ